MDKRKNQQKLNNKLDEPAKRGKLVAIYGEKLVTEAYDAATTTPGVPEGGEDPKRILEMDIGLWRLWHHFGRHEDDLIYCARCGQAGSLQFSDWSYCYGLQAGFVCDLCRQDLNREDM